MNLKKAANHGVHGGLGDKTEDCFVKEALKYSSPRRKPEVYPHLHSGLHIYIVSFCKHVLTLRCY